MYTHADLAIPVSLRTTRYDATLYVALSPGHSHVQFNIEKFGGLAYIIGTRLAHMLAMYSGTCL
jgi:hypothetical protein